MLDQNTDRMWYVIGAIVIGAAIIAMGLNIFSESFDSVDGMMASLTGIASDNVFSIGNDGIYTEEELDNLINNEGYIPVATADELDSIRKNEIQIFGSGSKWESEYMSGLDGKYIQVSNIDLRSIDNWKPVGYRDYEFTGTFDGAGLTIYNLVIDRDSEDHVGLFGRTGNALLCNIELKNVDINGRYFVGGLVGEEWNRTEIIHSAVTGNVVGVHNVGGITGYQTGGSSIMRSYVIGDIKAERELVGGITGHQWYSSITDSYMIGTVSGGFRYVGGLVGAQRESSSTYSYMVGEVIDGGNTAGSLVGHSAYVSSSDGSYFNKDVSGQSESAGGVGKTTSEMKQRSTYVGWDFDNIWQMQEGQYPTLR